MLGLSILMATSSPFSRVPKCTWATEAVAIGILLKVVKISSIDF